MAQTQNTGRTRERNNNRSKLLTDSIYIALFAAVIAICAQIRLPIGPIPFTLQTLGIFLAGGLLGAKKGTISVLIYILLGAVGVPVFNGFSGGPGVLFGVTGGYIIGFIFTALVVGIASDHRKKKIWILIAAMVVGEILCYAFGTAWYIILMNSQGNATGLWAALSSCVIPFLIPDAAKIAVSVIIINRLNKIIKI